MRSDEVVNHVLPCFPYSCSVGNSSGGGGGREEVRWRERIGEDGGEWKGFRAKLYTGWCVYTWLSWNGSGLYSAWLQNTAERGSHFIVHHPLSGTEGLGLEV